MTTSGRRRSKLLTCGLDRGGSRDLVSVFAQRCGDELRVLGRVLHHQDLCGVHRDHCVRQQWARGRCPSRVMRPRTRSRRGAPNGGSRPNPGRLAARTWTPPTRRPIVKGELLEGTHIDQPHRDLRPAQYGTWDRSLPRFRSRTWVPQLIRPRTAGHDGSWVEQDLEARVRTPPRPRHWAMHRVEAAERADPSRRMRRRRAGQGARGGPQA